MDNLIGMDLTNEELILIDVEVQSKDEAMNVLAKAIESQGRLNDFDGFIQSLYAREKEFPTAIGYSFAIPHGKSDSVKQATIAIGRLVNEISWSDDEKVKYLFMIAVPEKEAGNTHLKVLSQLSRMIMREEFRNSLKEAKSKKEIYELLNF